MESKDILSWQIQQFERDYRKEITDSAQSLADEEMPQITEELFGLFEQNGNRLKYEAVYFTRRRFLAVLGLQALLDIEEQGSVTETHLRRLMEVMEDVCQEMCWALPAHVDRKKENWEVTVDLFACETAQTLAELADRLKSQLPETFFRTIVEEIEKRVLAPYFSSDISYGNWECGNTNWNAVCAGSIGSVCLHLMRGEMERLEKCLKRVCHSLSYYPDGFSEDGVCLEGIGYFTYGMTFFVNFAQELYEYSQGKQNLFQEAEGRSWEEKMNRMAQFSSKCFFLDGRTVNFSDAESRETFRVGLSCVLRKYFPKMRFPNMDRAAGLHNDSCYRFAALKMDLLYPGGFLKERKRTAETDGAKSAGFFVLSDAQWCIGNAVSRGHTIGFACKGGNNGEPHNHNDVGHFIYEADGVILLADLGCGEYTEEYFSKGRYRILCNRSLGHSVPLISGMEQCGGAEHASSSFQGGEDGCVKMELSAAYPEKITKGFERSFRFDMETGELVIADNIVLAESIRGVGRPGVAEEAEVMKGIGENTAVEEAVGRNAAVGKVAAEDAAGRNAAEEREVVENLVTQIKPMVQKDRVLLEAGGIRCALRINTPEESEIRVLEETHINHQGVPEAVYLIQWNVPVEEGHAVSSWIVNVL